MQNRNKRTATFILLGADRGLITLVAEVMSQCQRADSPAHVNYDLNSFKGVIQQIILRSIIGVIKGDTRSLDYSSCKATPGTC